MRNLYLIGFLYLAVASYAVLRGPVPHREPQPQHASPAPAPPTNGWSWFQTVKPQCNALEVETAHRRTPPPDTRDGAGYSAACYALAGRTDRSREIIAALDGADQWKAAGIVFNVGHPIADMGDDRSAGPIMELVVEFWPNNYQALYHAGASAHALGHPEPARDYLQRFLSLYHADDFFTSNAQRILSEIGDR